MLQRLALLQWDDGPRLPRRSHRQKGPTEVLNDPLVN